MNQIYENTVSINNGFSVLIDDIPLIDMRAFTQTIIGAVEKGQRVCSLFGAKIDNSDAITLYVILADDEDSKLNIGKTIINGPEFPSITPFCPQVHLFEREIAEQFGIKPVGHPWLKPVRNCKSWTNRSIWDKNDVEYYKVDGDQIHEVAVGPVHAGVIEPGHYRFQCHGERVYHLEISLGYQHRGIERVMEGGPNLKTLHFMETVAGDTTTGHNISYCQIIEALSKTQKPVRAQALRGIALELERLANHVGDLGALSGDVGFLPTSSFCGRIRGEFLNLTASICGNRFGRGFIVPGGVGFDIPTEGIEEILNRVYLLEKEVSDAVKLLWDNQSVMARFTNTGSLDKDFTIEMGLVGPVARSSGVMRDVRYSHPTGIYRFSQIPVSIYESGDVLGRAYVRWLEIQKSITFVISILKTLPKGSVKVPAGELRPKSFSVVLNEGWRGEICHVAITDVNGVFSRYKIVDPSFHNWQGLAQVLRNQEISDFPLCNKSFNLSYCGHDL